MRIPRSITCWTLLALGLVSGSPIKAQEVVNKANPILSSLYLSQQKHVVPDESAALQGSYRTTYPSGLAEILVGDQLKEDPMIRVLLKFEGDPAVLRAHGVDVRKTNILTGPELGGGRPVTPESQDTASEILPYNSRPLLIGHHVKSS